MQIFKYTRIKICANFNRNFIETWSKSLKNNLRNLQKLSVIDQGTIEENMEKIRKRNSFK